MVSTRQTRGVNEAGTSSGGGEAHSSSNLQTAGPSKFTRLNTLVEAKTPVQTTFLLDMPQELLEKIFSYLSYKNIAHLRPVSMRMDQVCGAILNSTFQRLQKQMLVRFQNIKAKMPRRESARRNHPLACESDIVETLHMRLTLLQMTFGKHIERRHCCFFAGEILDEVYRILHYIKTTTKLARPYKVTDELFDLSTMAMEYFKENIEPRLPEIAYFGPDFLDLPSTLTTNGCKNYLCLDSPPLGNGNGEESKEDENASHNATEPPENYYLPEPLPQSNMVLRKRIRKIKQGMKKYNSQLSLLRQDLRMCKRKTAEQQKQIAEQQKQLAEQQKQTLEYATRLDENDKKNEETSRKFSTLLQELNKCKTELQYWRSKSPAIPLMCKGCGAVYTPIPQEDIQALVNQGVRPEGLGLTLDSSNSDNDNLTLNESLIYPEPETPTPVENALVQTIASTPSITSCKTAVAGVKRKVVDDIAPASNIKSTTANCPTSTNPEVKKPRRSSKVRSKKTNVH